MNWRRQTEAKPKLSWKIYISRTSWSELYCKVLYTQAVKGKASAPKFLVLINTGCAWLIDREVAEHTVEWLANVTQAQWLHWKTSFIGRSEKRKVAPLSPTLVLTWDQEVERKDMVPGGVKVSCLSLIYWDTSTLSCTGGGVQALSLIHTTGVPCPKKNPYQQYLQSDIMRYFWKASHGFQKYIHKQIAFFFFFLLLVQSWRQPKQ